MCVNFRPPDPALLEAVMGVVIDLHDSGFWRGETWKDYPAPIVRRGDHGQRAGLLASYGMVPRQRIPALTLGMDVLSQLHLYAAFGQQTLYVTDSLL